MESNWKFTILLSEEELWAHTGNQLYSWITISIRQWNLNEHKGKNHEKFWPPFFSSDHQCGSAGRNWEGEGCASSGALSWFKLNLGIIFLAKLEYIDPTFLYFSPMTSSSHLGMRRPTEMITVADLANTWTSTLTSKVLLITTIFIQRFNFLFRRSHWWPHK